MFGKGCQKHTLTGLDCRANLLPGHVAAAARIFFIVTVPDNNLDEEEVKEAEEEEELHAVPEALNGDIAVNVKFHEGWKMSYRLQRPEERTVRDYFKPFCQQNTTLLVNEHLLAAVDLHSRGASWEQRRKRQLDSLAIRRVAQGALKRARST